MGGCIIVIYKDNIEFTMLNYSTRYINLIVEGVDKVAGGWKNIVVFHIVERERSLGDL